MGHEGDEVGFKSAQFLLAFQRMPHFLLRPFAHGDVQTHGKDMILSFDVDEFGGDQNGVEAAALGTQNHFVLAGKAASLHFKEEGIAIVKIVPKPQLRRRASNHLLPRVAGRLKKRFVGFHKSAVAHPRNRQEDRAGAKGLAEALLRFAQAACSLGDALFKRCVELANAGLRTLALDELTNLAANA